MEGGVVDIQLQQCLLKEQLTSWVEELQQCEYTFQLYPKLDTDKDKWSNNHPMSCGDKEYVKHKKTHFERKISYQP